jgi:hypothetical protein
MRRGWTRARELRVWCGGEQGQGVPRRAFELWHRVGWRSGFGGGESGEFGEAGQFGFWKSNATAAGAALGFGRQKRVSGTRLVAGKMVPVARVAGALGT